MFESNSKLPKIFVYMMSLLAILMLVGLFFGVGYVSMPYFVALIICVLLFILDKKSNSNLTNYKLTYLLFEIVNLIAVISVIYYEYKYHTQILNLFLIMLVVELVLMCLIDVFVLKNKNLNKRINLSIDFIKLCSMICILTYFFGVSDLYFAIFAFAFELANIVLKIWTHFESRKKQPLVVEEKNEALEDIIHSGDSEGDGE